MREPTLDKADVIVIRYCTEMINRLYRKVYPVSIEDL